MTKTVAQSSDMPRVNSAMNKLPPQIGKSSDKEVLDRAKDRFKRSGAEGSDNRKNGEDDLKFANGEQWPADVAAQRNTDHRPCLTINKCKTFIHQITNDHRQNRPAINISPIGSQTDKKAAKIYSGMIRAIENDSSADIAYDTGMWNGVANGFGYWRLLADYESPETFNQVIKIVRVRNPFTVYMGDCLEPEGSDARWGFVSEMIPRDEFKEEYPSALEVSWDQGATGDTIKDWVEKDRIRVADYYEVEHEMEDLVQLSNGHVGWKSELSDDVRKMIEDGSIEIENERKSQRSKTMWYKITALEVLESAEFPSDGLIPIVRVIGDEIDINGKVTFSGVVRDMKDPQRMYNYWRTTEAEIVALQPKAPFIGEEGQFDGHEKEWQQANTKSMPYLMYRGVNVAGKAAPPPQRQPMTQAPSGVLQAIQGSAQDMQAVSGIRFDATINERMYDESGKALREIRRISDVGSYHYIDNFGRALKYTGKLLMKMIPRVYDTKRIINILREDGEDQAVQIDPRAGKALGKGQTPEGKPLPIFNPNVGKYGVRVTIGPSFATKRIEASEQQMAFVAKMPRAAMATADLIAKNMDWPDADQFAARLAKTLPPQLLQTQDMEDVPPQIQALISSQQMQMQQMQMQLKLAAKALQDKSADRAVKTDKTDKDFKAKVLAILQKSEADQQGVQGDHLDRTIEILKWLDEQLNPQEEPEEMHAAE